jgi:two-component system chemotaxis sensor kinase CheA
MNTDFFKINYHIPVEQASKLAMQRPFEQLYNPIVVEQEGKYSGIVTVKDLLDTCTKIARSERDEITVMKDNLKTGIFFMDRDCIIQGHYSRYLEEMLSEKDLSGKCFTSLLSASFNEKELNDIRNYFEMIFKHSFDQNMLDEINPLGEFHYVNAKTGIRKVFQCGFTAVEQARGEEFTLVTMYDVTAKTELQQRLAEEESRRQEEMKSVFELIQVEPHVFDDFLEDAEYEFDRINETLGNETMSAHAALVEIYQSLHAIKSNAVILGLNTFSEKVHKLESKIKKLREQKEAPFDEMLKLTMELEGLSQEKDGFKTTLKKINSFKSSSGGQRQGQYVLVESLTKTVNKACGDMGKKIKFIVDGIDDEAVEKGPRRIIKETLMQLVRNSAAHGIETPEDRIAQGKNETGVIRFSVKVTGGNIHVKLGDDGRGLDYRKIAEKALHLNLIKPENANDKNALLKAIFSPGFSTAETEGIHAGRGIGLSLVQDRVRSGKGSIKVHSETGKGTVFNIFFPIAA